MTASRGTTVLNVTMSRAGVTVGTANGPTSAVQAESLLRVGAVVLIEANAVIDGQLRRDLKLVLEEQRVVLEDVHVPHGPVVRPERTGHAA